MPEKVNKTDKEWDIINFKNSLGPQIGGLIHDAVALAIAYMKNRPDLEPEEIMGKVMWFLDRLYEVAENKKSCIMTPKSTDEEVKAF